MSDERRKEALSLAISNRLAREGTWRIESRTDFDAIIVGGKPVNHVLHLLLAIFTLGIWLLVWPFIAAAGGEKRYRMSIDEYGNGSFQPLG